MSEKLIETEKTATSLNSTKTLDEIAPSLTTLERQRLTMLSDNVSPQELADRMARRVLRSIKRENARIDAQLGRVR